MASPFVFKQFALHQEKAAFKLGTDSVLLGSWLPDHCYKKVLDLGAGTGILSLMVAQRFQDAGILAIEIDPDSVVDCRHNFDQSKWKERLEMIENDLFDWSKNNGSAQFDLIITNPPYFTNSLKNPDARKSIARHTDSIRLNDLANVVQQHLVAGGFFGCILPVNEFQALCKALYAHNIFLNDCCKVSSFEHGEIIREMGLFSRDKKEGLSEQHFLYKEKDVRSDWYKVISKDFYLK